MHQNGAKPMKSLKISRGVFIRAEELTMGEYQLRATFRVRDEMIEHAVLESEPERDWGEAAVKLRGMKVKEWQKALDVF